MTTDLDMIKTEPETKNHIITDFVDWSYDVTYRALDVLPDSPIQDFTIDSVFVFPGVGNVMSLINYFVPIGDFLFITAAYVSACGAYMGVRYALRMARYI